MGFAVALSLGVGLWIWLGAVAPTSHEDLEAAVKRVSAPGAAHPLGTQRWGNSQCAWAPLAGDCPNIDLFYSSGGVPADEYRAQWRTALERDGWNRHGPRTTHNRVWGVWWTRGDVAVTLSTFGDEEYDRTHRSGDGEFTVTAQGVGTRSGELPGPGWPN